MIPDPPQLEALSGGQIGVKVSTFSKPSVDSHWHFHPEVEVVWIEKGRGLLHSGRAMRPYGPGDLVLTGSNLPHAFTSDPSNKSGAKWTVLHFRPLAWGENFWALPENRPTRLLLDQAERGAIFPKYSANNCYEILRRMENRTKMDAPIALLLDLLHSLAITTSHEWLNTPNFSVKKAAHIDSRLESVLRKIETRFTESNLTQAEIAKGIGMSPQAFSRFFKNKSGRHFHRHLNELRVARACSILIGSRKSVTEIAYAVGFSNLSNFNRRFREITGMPPTAFRSNFYKD
ncbi:helix-turn-helix domain-containing protein [Puniceicoccus vermicola]|uniref:AraC family transcriptional regulator n=1 Tax=Puniceicoccus vermicola TaxID=388746 RepID=A0A7X1E3I7_9BACT|nr:AraC family transcriptional regulator [Puniceicoccus vermicola]MBC2601023.1 AraC family transcriptional regulator [Puniceicoccus vermicola]MBC2602966.1 AraC family transcriptional regulator [Puniceicoccus vermicola]MBC2603171.1 AraC family transcriptional regulator [Puniceicoccus vermicola]MBC2603196.1 AraC family transcriptional regulator [Puniceicoccus vermicola]